MKRIPFLLIYSRIIIALAIGIIAYCEIENKKIFIVVLMLIGILTDIFDGIIARKLNVSSEKLRTWDSNVDQFFWLIIVAAIFYLNFTFLKENFIVILVVILLDISAYIISYVKFRRTVATHAILSKFWAITLLIFLIDLSINSSSNLPFKICMLLGIISRIEIILIIIGLKEWTTDIPSIFSVKKINNGEKVKKSKLFNS
jgi:CDP-diacylglycerol--glycerol-3-phosphate 3-phosphatidyltransferase